jgi:Uma2 family endonuclease
LEKQGEGIAMQGIDTKHLTFADYLLLPTIMQRYDIIDGEMVMTAAPIGRHQWISGNLHLALRAYFDASPRGLVLYAPCDILIQREPLRTRQPDLFIFLRGRQDVGNLEELLEQPVIETAPDIAIEILSKNETRRMRTDKIEDYRRIGVKECWIVSPQAQTIEVLQLSAQGVSTLDIYGMGMALGSELLAGFELPVEAVFA